ncbi:hypothetical protein QYE73_22815 [Pseudomonas mosselii]|nr:hypothetical protein [Pseudomonas mosselii]MDN4500124.1 hypothetical protein [Pseudomonas mosselii]
MWYADYLNLSTGKEGTTAISAGGLRAAERFFFERWDAANYTLLQIRKA